MPCLVNHLRLLDGTVGLGVPLPVEQDHCQIGIVAGKLCACSQTWLKLASNVNKVHQHVQTKHAWFVHCCQRHAIGNRMQADGDGPAKPVLPVEEIEKIYDRILAQEIVMRGDSRLGIGKAANGTGCAHAKAW